MVPSLLNMLPNRVKCSAAPTKSMPASRHSKRKPCTLSPYESVLELIRTFPNFSADLMTAIAAISEIGTTMSVFSPASTSALERTAALTMIQAAASARFPHLPRQFYIKPLLVQTANTAGRSSKQPECKYRHRKLRVHLNYKKVVIISICRMLLPTIWRTPFKVESYNMFESSTHPASVIPAQSSARLQFLPSRYLFDNSFIILRLFS